MRAIFGLLIGIGCISVTGAANFQTVNVRAIGIVLNDPSDPLHTRQCSLIEAQRMAVEKALGVSVRAHSLVDKSILIQSRISTNSQGRIRHFDILDQREDGVYYKTIIEAAVDISDPATDSALDEQLANIPVETLAGILTWLNGELPKDEELKTVQQNPVATLRAFYAKLKADSRGSIPDRLLVSSLAKQIGLKATSADLIAFGETLTSTDE